METKHVPVLASGLFGDLITGFTSFGAGTLSAVVGIGVQEMLERRHNAAREILLDELRSADKTLSTADIDQSIAIAFRYARAAQEGAARLNLRLLAQVICGQAHIGNLVADEFLYWADMLASLKREEVILIATLKNCTSWIDVDDERGTIIDETQTWKQAVEQLVPQLFESEEFMRAIAGGVTRTGLLVSGSTMDGIAKFRPSPLLDMASRLCDFEAALRKEDPDIRR